MKYINIILAPMFVLLIHYFEFRVVVLVYLLLAIFYLFYKVARKNSYKDLIIPVIYVLALSLAYCFSSFQTIKYIPVTLSTIFMFVFIDSHYNKKYLILDFTEKFYHKELKEEEIEFLKKGDGYWVIVMFINTIIHLFVVNFASDIIWAFYSSIGWYILFFTALIGQIIYGKVYGAKVHIG
ncbi:MAG: hypothetical protein L3J44_00020 [Campylobacteraceae bacterium]|nr:hypothetical protein [Campylobacteraceae bacterium]